MEEAVHGYMATICAFKQMADPEYKQFVNDSLKDFIDNKRKKKQYSSPALNAQSFQIVIQTLSDGKFIICDKDDKKPKELKHKN